ncbi:phage tail tape measure protein [Elstera cyanobacteriorum]|uniref:phage tail tape measure protein n=1 Tax=Elstera cyanobacteriorum TaxID=2022747 RepID=UPI0023565815|nr:phage tail tape measure protein [Elstera cyanobacteriorum]MCK6442273.1 phage tail tape measure protein [Elstera cyanobacteriorum]
MAAQYQVSILLRAINQTSGVISKVRSDLQGLATAQGRIAAEQANLARRADYRGQLVDATAMGASLYAALKPAIAFESAMADVRKVTDMSAAETRVFGAEILQMGRRLPVAHDGLAKIAAEGGRLGLGKAELQQYTEVVSKMATAWDVTPEKAGAAMAKVKNIFGLGMKDLELVGDAINTLDDSSSASAGDILEFLRRAGSSAKMVGMSAQQTAAWGTAMLDLGATSDVAATGFNALVMKLATAPAAGKKFLGALAEMGLDPNKVQSDVLKDPNAALVEFFDKFKVLSKAQQMNLFADLFGMEYSDDMLRVFSGLDKLKQHLGTAGDQSKYAGSMQREYNTRMETTAAQLQLAANRFTEVAIAVGTALLPGINALLGIVGPAASGIADLAQQFPTVTKYVGGAVAALIALKVAMIGLGYAGTFVKGGLLSVAGAFGWLLQKFGLGGRGGGAAGAAGLAAGLLKGGVQPVFVVNMPGSGFGGLPGIGDLGKAAKGGVGEAVKDAAKGGLGGRVKALIGGVAGAGVLGMAGKLAKPIGMAMDVYDFGSAAVAGDARGMGSSAGSLVGGLGGAWGGAAAGAAIGSIVPFVGTAIGGVIGAALGGWFGSSGGSALGAEIADNLANKSALSGAGATTKAQEMAAWFRGEKPALSAEQVAQQRLKGDINLNISGLPAGVTATATSKSGDLNVLAKSGPNLSTAF